MPWCSWRIAAVKHRSASPSDRPIFLMPYLMKTFHTLGALIAASAEQNEIKKMIVPFRIEVGTIPAFSLLKTIVQVIYFECPRSFTLITAKRKSWTILETCDEPVPEPGF